MGRAKSSSWSELVRLSEACAEQVAVAFRRQSWRRQDDTERRIAEAHQLVQMGEIAFVRQALEGAGLAPGTRATLDILRDPARRPNLPRNQCPTFQPMLAFPDWMRHLTKTHGTAIGARSRSSNGAPFVHSLDASRL